MPRPTIMSPETIVALESAFRDGANVEEACQLANISRSTFYDHKQSDEEFSDKMASAQSYLSVIAKSNVAKALKAGDLKLTQWWLERKARDEFDIRQELPSPPQSPIMDMTRDQLNDKIKDLLGKLKKQAEYEESSRVSA